MSLPACTVGERWLLAATLAFGALAVVGSADVLHRPPWVWLGKPLATAMLVALAWRRGAPGSASRRAVLAGLVLSWCGDVALMWPQQGFLPGLVCFLLAHLAYLVAFTRGHRLVAGRIAPFVLYAVVAGAILWRLWPGVPAALHGPVAAYVLCLAAMASQAAVVWRCSAPGPDRDRGALLALGGALFVASDALLATNRFGSPVPQASLWILSTYWAAQACIAMWLAPRGPGWPAKDASATCP